MIIRLEILNGPGAGETRIHRRAECPVGPLTVRVDNGQGRLLIPEGVAVTLNDHPVPPGQPLLEPGDEIEVDGVRYRYVLIQPPQPLTTRSLSALEWSGLALLLLFLAGQAAFLLFVAPRWRAAVHAELLGPPPKPTPTPIPEPTPTPAPPTPTPLPQPTPTPAPEPTPTPRPPPTPTPIPGTESLTVTELLQLARQRIRENRDLDADRLFLQAIFLAPHDLDIRMERARHLHSRGLLPESAAAWEDILRRAEPGSPIAREASAELRLVRRKLEVIEATPTPASSSLPPSPSLPPLPPQPLPTLPPTPTPGLPPIIPRLRIENIDTKRLTDTPASEDRRHLTFRLRHLSGQPAIPSGSIQVRVTFYEQTGSRIHKAGVPEPVITLQLTDSLSAGRATEELNAWYEAPRGRGLPGRQYYGAIIEVFIDGRKEAVAADPITLLKE